MSEPDRSLYTRYDTVSLRVAIIEHYRCTNQSMLYGTAAATQEEPFTNQPECTVGEFGPRASSFLFCTNGDMVRYLLPWNATTSVRHHSKLNDFQPHKTGVTLQTSQHKNWLHPSLAALIFMAMAMALIV